MSVRSASPPSFWHTVLILLAAARKRSSGREKRQQQLLHQRSKDSADWSGWGFFFAIILMLMINVFAALSVRSAVESGQRAELERQGKLVVSERFIEQAKKEEATPEGWIVPDEYSREAKRIEDEYGGARDAIEKQLRRAVKEHGSRDLVASEVATPGLTAVNQGGRFPAMLGSLVLFWWLTMMAFQGEGLELDIQRRRHPMWEWLFSHPVRPGAVFLSEMLSPLAANPAYWGGPLFASVVFSFAYDAFHGLIAGFVIGIPITIAAACMGKALEIAVILRFPARSRGAIIGLMSWAGYASLLLFFVGFYAVPRLVSAMSGLLVHLTMLPWPWLGLFLGARADGTHSFIAGVASSFVFSVAAITLSVWFSAWGAQRGLSGTLENASPSPSTNLAKATRFGKDPLYRKEFLWFIRDRSAIVQSILIPLTVAGFQIFNLRGVLSMAQGTWNYLSGAAILFGTYFLWVLGPKSLSSEGTALWIPMTWPRGLESLLKAKAWLWALISSAMVAMVLVYAAFVFPENIWQIALVGIGWFFFARSMADKTVTLVTVTSSSGEQQKIPWGRRLAAQLGMLTFAIGVITRQWHVAVNGIVFSYITAAAMWQNFRARLPYLHDPWSEEVPPPPTLMHAMVAASILIELGAVLAGILVAAAGRENVGVSLAFSYGISAIVVCIGVTMFLSDRGVPLSDVLHWPEADGESALSLRQSVSKTAQLTKVLSLGIVCGLALGIFARGYESVLNLIPAAHEIIQRSQEQMAQLPGLRLSYAVMAVGFAPFAEEYLFRGLLYRALDREWGGWRAVLGSAAFFAIYHPALAWLPVGLLGAANAVLFKKTGRLAPAVLLHMVYNAIVLS